MRVGGLIVVGVLLVLVATPVASAQERIQTDVSYTRTLAAQDHDAFEVIVPAGQARVVSFTASGVVDFYVLVQSEYAEYTDPNSTGFYAIDDRENARDFSHTAEATGRIYVIDNADFSITGASPSGPVTYTITVAGPSILDQLFVRSCWGWAVLGILLVLGTVYWLYTPPKAFRETSKQLQAMLGGK